MKTPRKLSFARGRKRRFNGSHGFHLHYFKVILFYYIALCYVMLLYYIMFCSVLVLVLFYYVALCYVLLLYVISFHYVV